MKTSTAKSGLSRQTKDSITGLLMVFPSFLLLVFIVILPISLAVRESLLDPNGALSLANYKYLFTDKAMKNNIIFTLNLTVVSTVITLILGYILAIYLRFSKGRISEWIRKLYFIPMFIPAVIATYGIINMYGNHGWLARIVLALGGDSFPRFIYDYNGLLLANLWFNIPFTAMLLSSALAGIPNSLIESARDVGAGKLNLFTKFIVPMTYKTVLVAATFSFMGIIGSFTAPFLIGPNAPQVLGIAMQQSFSIYHDVGIASAMAVFMFLLCSAMGYFYIRSMVKEEPAGR
ncbi:ABC transporter permease subunit [Paenibacillus sp. LC-T2]|uniref:ABC transporter permease subunit n=2 Tax=Paenibacillus monticola TaxID=2666075 RepID=A0A7X2H173_9BACL|nr:ABC transporter permease subunit [Paenibacillus monticola]